MLVTTHTVFPGELTKAAQAIRELYPHATYDHRPFLPPGVSDRYLTNDFRVGYACFKATVAYVLKPAHITEIGVGLGVSALAFLDGLPFSIYHGIDNDCESGRDFPVKPSEFVSQLLSDRGYTFDMRVADSAKLDRLPATDLVHIDGAHDFESAYLDMLLAWRSKASWILIDDARDSVVSAAVFAALQHKSPGSVDWAYFEDTYTGNLLISRRKDRP